MSSCFRLSGNTLFVLLTRAMKPHGRNRSSYQKRSEGITEANMLADLIRVYYPLFNAPQGTINSYTSSSPWIAEVDDSGSVTAKNAGKAKITAETTDGSKKSCILDVVVEPSVPISLDSIGFGIYNYNLLAITVTNRCSTFSVVDFDFDLTFYDYSGNIVNGGSYSLGDQVRIGPGRTQTIKRTIYGAGQAYKTVITITGVKFSDGSYWNIPKNEQESWAFTR